MSRIDIANAIIKVTEKVKSGEVALIDEAIMDSIGDAEYYVQQAVAAALRRDAKGLVKSIQDAQMSVRSHALQLGLPGLEHAALPSLVTDLDAPPDKPRMKSAYRATAREIRAEIKTYRRSVNARDRIVSGYEATWDAIAANINIDDDMTGEEIEQAVRSIEAS